MKKGAAQSGKTKPRPRRLRPKLVPISEEMRHWSAMLETEVCTWPKITTKPMFGFMSFYRGGTIFAGIPRSRGFGAAASFILKFNSMPRSLLQRAQKDARLDTATRIPGKGWFSFEISSNEDLRDALWWLGRAYDSAKSATR